MTTSPTLEEIQGAIHAAAATVRGSRIAELELALKALLESLRYTPLGIPQIKALAACELALAAAPAPAPTGERVELTDEEAMHFFHIGSGDCKMSGPLNRRDLAGIRRVIAAHEAKRNWGAA